MFLWPVSFEGLQLRGQVLSPRSILPFLDQKNHLSMASPHPVWPLCPPFPAQHASELLEGESGAGAPVWEAPSCLRCLDTPHVQELLAPSTLDLAS